MGIMLYYVGKNNEVCRVGKEQLQKCRGGCLDQVGVNIDPKKLADAGCPLAKLILGLEVTAPERAGCTHASDFDKPTPPIPRDVQEHALLVEGDPAYRSAVIANMPPDVKERYVKVHPFRGVA